MVTHKTVNSLTKNIYYIKFFTNIVVFFIIYTMYKKKLRFKENQGKSRNILKSWKLRNKGNF